MAASYPGALKSFSTWVNKQDDVDAALVNAIQDEVVAIETELGVDVAGTRTDLEDRLAQCIATDGSMRQGTSNPANGELEGDFFYRTDEDTMYIYDGAAWDAVSSAVSNLIFAWSGNHLAYTTGDVGIQLDATYPDAAQPAPQGYYFYITEITSHTTVLSFRLTKIAGLNTVTIHALLEVESGNTGTCEVDIGGQSGDVTSTSTTPAWATVDTVDISGLSDGTTYTGIIQIKSSIGANCMLWAITLIGS